MRVPCGWATELAEYRAVCPYPQSCTSSPLDRIKRLRPAPERSGWGQPEAQPIRAVIFSQEVQR